MHTSNHTARALVALCCALCAWGCNSPSDIDTARVQHTSFVDTGLDDPAFDTLAAVLDTQIRFEAVVDTTKIRIDRFTGTGLRIAIAVVRPGAAGSDMLEDVYSLAANYLDVPATALPLRARLDPRHFVRYIGARIAIAFVLLYRDDTMNQRYDPGEPVYGAGEQHAFAWVEGRLSRIPTDVWGEVREGANKLVLVGGAPAPRFKATPDYTSSIFIINVRGPDHSYSLPWPWMPGSGTMQGSASLSVREAGVRP